MSAVGFSGGKLKRKETKDWFSKVKSRLHFDTKLSKNKANGIVSSEDRILTHCFLPFMYFRIEQFKLAKKKLQIAQGLDLSPFKIREIFYSCYADSYIFSYYNELLLNKYEKFIISNNIEGSIAYRHIDKNASATGKSNIDFAAEAFKEIESRKECYAVGLDIKNFFNTLNWSILKKNLCELLGEDRLPNDWYQIYKILTDYHYIDLDEFLHCKYIKSNRRDFWNDTTHSLDRICSLKTFRNIIKEFPELIKGNKLKKGIPQGISISGTFANVYMIYFDMKIETLVKSLNGYYRRYSDDILIVVNKKEDLNLVLDTVKNEIKQLDLELSDDKTICCKFVNEQCYFESCALKQDVSGAGIFQYLGFTYNGSKILLRNSTLSRFWKFTFRHSRNMVLNNFYNDKRIPIRKIYGLYTHLANNKSKYGNFYQYVRKAQKIFEEDYDFGEKVAIKKQLSNSWNILHKYLYRLKVKHNIPDEKLKISL